VIDNNFTNPVTHKVEPKPIHVEMNNDLFYCCDIPKKGRTPLG